MREGLWCTFGLLCRRWFWIYIMSHVIVGSRHAAGDCHFPESWNGIWFQSGVQRPTTIQGSTMSSKGRCVASDGDKYILEDTLERGYRCIVIHQRHQNVLQYKETYVYSHPEPLNNLCSQINGDALLYSMFRVDASPVACPFKGPFSFVYNRGLGECRSPMSSIDSCSEDFRVRLRYQACADVSGTESHVEDLVCMATWREGSMRYLVGKLEYSMASSDEDKFRCFVYDKFKDGSGFMVAQSGDATCNGLFSASEGSKTMKLYKAPAPHPKCHFPTWLTQGHHWSTLDGRKMYSFGHKHNSFRIVDLTGAIVDTHVSCMDELHNHDGGHVLVVGYTTVGCSSGYTCYSFIKRGNHVVEAQQGNFAKSIKEACDAHHFDRIGSEYTTLVTALPERKRCPFAGLYKVAGFLFNEKVRMNRRHADCDTHTAVNIGCDSSDTIEFQYTCNGQYHVQAFHCHSHWEENGTSYLITTQKGMKSKYCFLYSKSDNHVVKFSSVKDSCHRHIQPGVGGFWSFNFTATSAPCDPKDEPETPPPSLTTNVSSASQIFGAAHSEWLILTLFCTLLFTVKDLSR